MLVAWGERNITSRMRIVCIGVNKHMMKQILTKLMFWKDSALGPAS